MISGGHGARAVLALAIGLAASLPGAAPAAPPEVAAPQAILVEPVSGDVLFSRQAHAPRPVASATKLMTALVVLERASLDDWLVASPYSPISPAETRLGLAPAERMTVRDLLRALLLASANDAAQTLAERTAGSSQAFVELMNQRARRLGLRSTHFANPIGLDEPGNHSSAADLVKLTRRLRQIPFFAQTVALRRVRLDSGRRPRVVDNRNDLVESRAWVTGVKTGHTQGAGYVLVGSATRQGVSVLSAVLGDPSEAARDADTLALLEYGLAQFRSVAVVRRERPLGSAAIRHREQERVVLRPARTVTRVLRRGERAALRVTAPAVLEGPLPAGAAVGAVQVTERGKVVARVPLLTATPVPRVGILERALDLVLEPATLAGAGAAALAAGLLAVSRRRRAHAGGDRGSKA